MTPDPDKQKTDLERVEELCSEALTKPATERGQFLESACRGDKELQREVESLLASLEKDGALLEGQALEMAARMVAKDQAPSLTEQLVGKKVGHFEVLQKIGRGGMGEVYQVRDTQLDRMVALKILPFEMASNPDRLRRFVQEAKAASALNHPNIATIYEIGQSEGLNWIAMELIQGETLTERLKSHALEMKEVMNIAIQAAEALKEAHDQGIIHRDIKPANIMLTRHDQVKVLDFGLAKRIHLEMPAEGTAASTESQTSPGVIMGTVDYMSPEQVLGQEVDRRTDLFSLGVVFYVMVTSRFPFSGISPTDTMGKILHAQPEAMTRFNQKAPPELERIVRKCLEKDRELRYQSAGNLLLDLRRLKLDADSGQAATLLVTADAPSRAVEVLPPPKRRKWGWAALQEWFWGRPSQIRALAVLPLVNLSGDPDQEYFADGMTEALITDLSKIRVVKVISRTSVMQYKGVKKPLREIARALGVGFIIEGSVQRAAQQVRITAQLISTATDTHLWAERYERNFRDVLTLQGEVAQAVAREIRIVLTPEESKRLARARPVNPEAYDAYLKGQFHWYKLSREHLDMAHGYFQLALEKDPNCALAYVGISNVWLMRGDAGFMLPGEVLAKAKTAVSKALEIDDTLAEAHIALANITILFERNWSVGEREFRRGLELNPNNADGHMFYADYLISIKRMEGWKKEIQRARELDPFNLFIHCFYGWLLVFVRRYDEAISQLHKVLATEPGFSSAHMGLWGAFYKKGMPAEALAEARQFFRVLGDYEVEEALGRGCAKGGYAGGMLLGAETLAARSNQTHVPAVRIARLYAHAGENHQAIEWLEKAWGQRETPLMHLQVAWDWDHLRDDPRFQNLLRRMNFPS
jgi:serine/threonine protein kinase/tetratricopeptide (TPR) repeat protein